MKKKVLRIIIILFILGLFGTLFINLYMINKTKNRIVSIEEVQKLEDIDAIMVLGCKAYSDGPSLMLSNRLEKGKELYEVLQTKLLLSGDHGKKNYDEVNVMKDYMIEKGINTRDIFLDHAGFSTYDSIYRAKYVFEAQRIVIVTQKYHMSRALYLANALGIDAYGVIADDIPQKSIMIKNEIREILSRDKNFFKAIFKPQSKYLGEVISLKQDGNVTNG